MISELVQRELVSDDLDVNTREEALSTLARSIARHNEGVGETLLVETLRQREQQATTAFGDGVAIPHARIPGLARMVAAFGRSKKGIDWNAPDQRPVHLVLMLAGPSEKPEIYLKTLAAASRLLRDPHFRSRLLSAANGDEIMQILRDDTKDSSR